MRSIAALGTLPVIAESVPDELKVRPQWVNWKYSLTDKDKWAKHPYNPRTKRKASSTDLLTWSPFETVLEAYGAGGYDGLGFVFCSGDPFTGVDLDGCRDPESGEVAPWAADIVRNLDSYTELSPSGSGLHIIVKGKIPAPIKRGQIEMYCIERYFTVTGHAISVEDR